MPLPVQCQTTRIMIQMIMAQAVSDGAPRAHSLDTTATGFVSRYDTFKRQKAKNTLSHGHLPAKCIQWSIHVDIIYRSKGKAGMIKPLAMQAATSFRLEVWASFWNQYYNKNYCEGDTILSGYEFDYGGSSVTDCLETKAYRLLRLPSCHISKRHSFMRTRNTWFQPASATAYSPETSSLVGCALHNNHASNIHYRWSHN